MSVDPNSVVAVYWFNDPVLRLLGFRNPGSDQLFSETNFTTADFKEFSVNDKGVTFYYDYGFPHVLEALQPSGEFMLDWRTLKPFIRRDGLLGRFVR